MVKPTTAKDYVEIVFSEDPRKGYLANQLNRLMDQHQGVSTDKLASAIGTITTHAQPFAESFLEQTLDAVHDKENKPLYSDLSRQTPEKTTQLLADTLDFMQAKDPVLDLSPMITALRNQSIAQCRMTLKGEYPHPNLGRSNGIQGG